MALSTIASHFLEATGSMYTVLVGAQAPIVRALSRIMEIREGVEPS